MVYENNTPYDLHELVLYLECEKDNTIGTDVVLRIINHAIVTEKAVELMAKDVADDKNAQIGLPYFYPERIIELYMEKAREQE